MPSGLCPLGAGSQAAPCKGLAASVATFALESKPQNLFFLFGFLLLFLKRPAVLSYK